MTGGRMISGKVEYTDRGFEQDTHDAMRGDIVRGLIELITNADDAYVETPGASGKILIEVEHKKNSDWKVVVRDRAKGMGQTDLISKITKLAERSSGFESGKAVRGNLGRGAKDVSAFGRTQFESICNDKYAFLELHPNRNYDALEKPRIASPEDKSRLGIPRGNGTVVTIMVGARIRCPNHSTLVERLSKHFQLRGIMSDPNRSVSLTNLNSGEAERLRYVPPDSAVLRKVVLEIPGYPDASAGLEIRRLSERCDKAASDPFRPSGILVKGQRAIYENTLFSYESNPYAAFIHGSLDCPYIDVLAREYDDRRDKNLTPTEENNEPIITRSRDGLHSEHRFVMALRKAAESVVGDVVREEEERIRREAAKMESENTRRSLDKLAREVTRFMEDELRSADAEELASGGSAGHAEAEALAVIPGEVICYLDTVKTITVAARREGLHVGSVVTVTAEPEGVVELVDGAILPLKPHKKREDLLVAQIRLRPLVPDVTLLQCKVEGREAEGIVEVREERLMPPEPEPPATFEFERPRYRVGWMKKKTIVLRAPLDLLPVGTTVRVRSDGPGIVVLTGSVKLEEDVSERCLRAEVRLDGRKLGSEAQIMATVDGFTAKCHALVADSGDGPSLRFELVDKDGGMYRALWQDKPDAKTGDTIKVLEIMGRHEALKRYLGEAPAFPGQEMPWVKTLIAEIVADNVCREIARRVDALRTQDERPDAEAFYREHYARMSKILPKLHMLMLGTVPLNNGFHPS